MPSSTSRTRKSPPKKPSPAGKPTAKAALRAAARSSARSSDGSSAKTAGRGLTIAFQGEPGAFSHIACRAVFPGAQAVPCTTFDDAFAALAGGKTDLAMIPIENAIAGRVADVHHLIPASNLHIIGEHFQPVSFCLLGTKDSKIKDLTHVHSHVMALPQCRRTIRRLNLTEVTHADTAGAAAQIAQTGDKTQAAIASELAGEIYGLKVLERDIQNIKDNVTRFIILSRDALLPKTGTPCITSFLFRGQSIPAFLYKALGAFATNQINFTKIESYLGKGFRVAEFYCEVEGHPDEPRMQRAFREIDFFTAGNYKILGTYTAHAFRSRP